MYASFSDIIYTFLPVLFFEVAPESGLMCKAHFTVVALVRSVTAMEIQVVLQRTFLSECLPTDRALVGLDSRVYSDVPRQITLLREDFTTAQTQEKFVSFQMADEVFEVLKNFTTFTAMMGLLKPFVLHFNMIGVHGFVCEQFCAPVASE